MIPLLKLAAVSGAQAISDHQSLDTDAGWEEVEINLPEVNPPRAKGESFDDDLCDAICLLLSQALRVARTASLAVANVTFHGDEDFARNLQMCLIFVLDHLGVKVDDDLIDLISLRTSAENTRSERVQEALVDRIDLVSARNDPGRHYQSEIVTRDPKPGCANTRRATKLRVISDCFRTGSQRIAYGTVGRSMP